MFELSLIDLALLVGGGAVLLGKRELPVVARYCGKGTGKLVSLLNTVRDTMQNQSEKHGLKQFQDEVKKNLHQLNTVRSDLQFAGRSHPYHEFRSRTLTEGNSSSLKTRQVQDDKAPLEESLSTASVNNSSHLLRTSVISNLNTTQNCEEAINISSANQTNVGLDKTLPNTAHLNKSYLGKIALAEIVLNEKEKGIRNQAETRDPERSGSDLVSNVILESLLNDQFDRLQNKQ